MRSACSTIELARHAALADRLLSCGSRLLLTFEGDFVSSAGALGLDDGAVISRLVRSSPVWWQSDTPLMLDYLDQQLCVLPLQNHLGSSIANLVVIYERPVDNIDWIARRLKPLAEGVASELNLNVELDEMAAELTLRYEELNLVFETQDDVEDYSDAQTYLKQLVENCHSYMEVGLCLLVLNGQDESFSSVSNRVSSDDAEAAMEKFGTSLSNWMIEHRETLVVNNFEDPAAAVACAGVPNKIIAAPVLGRRELPMGMLVVAKPLNEPDFTNSDRNLLEVMARKTAKILLSSYDELTGLLRRPGFEQQLHDACQHATNFGGEHALLLLNVDRMKVINDNFGTAGGDAAIRKIAETLRVVARIEDTVARLEGDEFGVVLRNCPADKAEAGANKFLEAIVAQRVNGSEAAFEVAASIGVVPIADRSLSVEALLGSAEVAQTLAKDQGGQQVCLFQSGDKEVARRQGHMQMVGYIQDALRLDKFELFAQPILPLSEKGSLHAEILLRMRSDDGEMISPAAFLPAAERYHLMPSIDRWVLAHTLKVLDARSVFDNQSEMVFTINLTGQSLSDSTFADFVDRELNKYQFPDNSLCFEITETTAIGDLINAQKFIANMRKRKVLFALDDFGTGLSSFAILKQLDLDYLKIDGCFVRDICNDHVAEAMVRAISDVARSMSLSTVGEFVVDLATRDKLIEMGVDYGQGFALAQPQPLIAVIDSLDELVRNSELFGTTIPDSVTIAANE